MPYNLGNPCFFFSFHTTADYSQNGTYLTKYWLNVGFGRFSIRQYLRLAGGHSRADMFWALATKSHFLIIQNCFFCIFFRLTEDQHTWKEIHHHVHMCSSTLLANSFLVRRIFAVNMDWIHVWFTRSIRISNICQRSCDDLTLTDTFLAKNF